jgi:hypothetical protein
MFQLIGRASFLQNFQRLTQADYPRRLINRSGDTSILLRRAEFSEANVDLGAS